MFFVIKVGLFFNPPPYQPLSADVICRWSPCLLASVGRPLPLPPLPAPDDEEGLDVVVGEELVALAAAARLNLEGVVQVLQGRTRDVHPTACSIEQKTARSGAAKHGDRPQSFLDLTGASAWFFLQSLQNCPTILPQGSATALPE